MNFETEGNVKLIFSSFGFNKPIPAEKFALVIEKEGLEKKSCCIIPYAGFNVEKTYAREKAGLVNFGFSPNKIFMLEREEQILETAPDYIYVPGGDPFKLLQFIHSLGVRSAIQYCVLDCGTTYIGVSAGADLATEDIEYVLELEDNNHEQKNFSGLNLLPEIILCHADHYLHATLRACREASGKEALTIRDDQVILYENGAWRYVGEDL